MRPDASFLCGVVEGFYGRPWSASQRCDLVGRMARWGLNTYLYAPKDDLFHRTRWRERYPAVLAGGLRTLIRDCRRRGIGFVYAIAPGLDICHSSAADERALWRKVAQVAGLGCRDFALLFDDIPDRLSAGDARRFGTVAAAQSEVANRLRGFLEHRVPGGRLLFCPTAYCGRMCRPSVRESAYLRELGEKLMPGIGVLWTGPEIISEEIPVATIREVRRVLRRKPVIWDNLHANDYDLRRLYLGPYSGRPAALREEIGGVLTNPNCEYEVNFVAVRTLAAWVTEGRRYDATRAYRRALREWLPGWRTRGPRRFGLGDLTLLADCLHLPHRSGVGGKRLVSAFRRVLAARGAGRSLAVAKWHSIAGEVEGMFERLTALEDRGLLYTIYRHAWELKEEILLLRRYADWVAVRPGRGEAFTSGEHRPGIYRGGLVADLQRLLPMDAEGRFRPGLNGTGR